MQVTPSFVWSNFYYPQISRPPTFELWIWCQKLGLYASIYGNFAQVCRRENWKRVNHASDQAILDESEEDDYLSCIMASKKRSTVTVLRNGIKGCMDADSCASANVMDREQFVKIAAASNNPMELGPANDNLYAYGQEKPIKLEEKFTAPIQSIVTGRKTVAEFRVMENKAKSRLLMSLETGIKLGLIHITNSM